MDPRAERSMESGDTVDEGQVKGGVWGCVGREEYEDKERISCVGELVSRRSGLKIGTQDTKITAFILINHHNLSMLTPEEASREPVYDFGMVQKHVFERGFATCPADQRDFSKLPVN